MSTLKHQQCPLEGMGFDQRFGHHLVSIKVGKYQAFNSYLYTNQRHYHDCYELVIVLEGQGRFQHKNMEHKLKSGDIFLSEPFAEHEIHVTPSGSLTVFYLFFKFNTDVTLTNHCYEEQLIDAFTHGHAPYKHQNKALLSYLNFINDYSTSTQRRSDHWTAHIVFDLLLNSIERLCQTPPSRSSHLATHDVNTFEHMLDYIDQNIEQKITAMSISEAIGLSRSTIYNMFREHLECTVHAYIKEKKMALAKHYLIMNLPVGEVAGLIGYDSLAQFSRTFKAVEGISPTGFTKSLSKTPIGIGRRLTDH